MASLISQHKELTPKSYSTVKPAISQVCDYLEENYHQNVSLAELADLVRQGKILHIGLSDTPAWIVSEGQAIAKLRGWTPVSAIQIHYNLVERTSEAELIPILIRG